MTLVADPVYNTDRQDPEDVLIGGQKFKAVEVVDLSESAGIPEHRVEDGYPVADHIFFQPAEIQLNLTLLENEVEALKQLYESKQQTTIVCKAGVFDDMVIKELDITQGGSKNTFRAVVRAKQILKAKAKTATIPLQTLQVTSSEDDAPGGKTTTPPPQTDVPSTPQKEENKSWLDSIFDWFGGLFGGG